MAQIKQLVEEGKAVGSVRLFSVRHEFPSEWAAFKRAGATAASLAIDLKAEHYPFWSQAYIKKIKQMDFFAAAPEGKHFKISHGTEKIDISPAGTDHSGLYRGKLDKIPLPAPIGKFTLNFSDSSMDELWMAVTWGG